MSGACDDAAARARHLGFHGSPRESLGPLERLAESAGGTAAGAECGWLVAVTLGGLGRSADAVRRLEPLLAGDSTVDPRVAALARATLASLLRQVGRHGEAECYDECGLRLAAPLGSAGAEALLDCRVGLVADAVGQGRLASARDRLAVVRASVDDAARVGQDLWRSRLRAEWVSAEVALMSGRASDAVLAGAAAVAGARAANAPRHLAKGLLFLGVATTQVGDTVEGLALVRQAAELAGQIGALPLVWPAHAVLADMLVPEAAGLAERHRVVAARAVRALATGLPPDWRESWIAGPDVSWLLEG